MRFLWVGFIISLSLSLLMAGVVVLAGTEPFGLPPALAGVGASANGISLPAAPGTPAPVSEAAPTHTQTPLAPGESPLTFNAFSPLTVNETITPTQEAWHNFAPLILWQFVPTPTPTPPPPDPRKVLVCGSPNAAIPDNNSTGKTVTLTIDDPGQVVDVRLYMYIQHPWVGDLTARVEHLGLQAKLFDRPGVPEPPDGSFGCGLDNIRAIFDEGMAHEAENICFNSFYSPAIGGSFYSLQPLNVFFAQPASGTWSLRLLDESLNDTGTIIDWCLDLTVLDGTPTPVPTPPPVSLPSKAAVSDMSGQNQLFPLDCESRSAVDWARHWDVTIGETTFFYGLPTSVNPEKGFVGDVFGTPGQVPPADYGVHAAPIAVRLREFGLKAQARKYMRWDDLRAEIAAGRPVIVWIIDTLSPGAPRYYNPGTGPYTITAPYEHTMIVTGYTTSTVTLLDGATFREVSVNSFLDSWSALGNMGVVYVP